MNAPTLGQLLNAQYLPERDAVHVAIVPLIAGEDLSPGRPFRIKRGTTDVALSGEYSDRRPTHIEHGGHVGIVDPFLNVWTVKAGDAFWGMLYPGTITGLRHHWFHPVLDDPEKFNNEHEAWLIGFADKYNFNFDAMIEEAEREGEWRYVVAQGIDLHGADDLDPGELQEFWHHIEGYLGKKFSDDHKAEFGWSCSC